MSVHSLRKKITAPDITASKGRKRIVSLTACTKPMAQLIDPHVDLIMVGDALGMIGYGMENTLGVTLDMMIYHGAAVVRGTVRSCVIVDMPFGSYEESPLQAFRNAARVMVETGAQGVKIEGGREMAETVAYLKVRGIPVMSHIGLMPQHINNMGGFKVQGQDEENARRIYEDAKALSEAGAFSLLIEGTTEALARLITESIPIPTIGIGASPACDGQLLVTEDLLGLFPDFTPKFARRYIDLSSYISEAVSAFAQDVRSGAFPGPEHCFSAKAAEKQ